MDTASLLQAKFRGQKERTELSEEMQEIMNLYETADSSTKIVVDREHAKTSTAKTDEYV